MQSVENRKLELSRLDLEDLQEMAQEHFIEEAFFLDEADLVDAIIEVELLEEAYWLEEKENRM